MSIIEVRRLDRPWQDLARDYRVEIDGEKRAKVGNDAIVRLPVAPGKHKVRLAIDWCGSREIDVDVADGQVVRLECRPSATPLLLLMYITFWRNKYITLDMVTP